MEKGALAEADVHEGGLDPGQDRFDFAPVDVADDPPDLRPVKQELDKAVVLQDGDPGLPRGRGDENLSFQEGNPVQCQIGKSPRENGGGVWGGGGGPGKKKYHTKNL